MNYKKIVGKILKTTIASLGATLFLSGLLSGGHVFGAVGTNVAVPTQKEIREYIQSHEVALPGSLSFSQNPVTAAPYGAGSLSQVTLQSALDTFNAMRYIAGVPADVTLDANYNQLTQTAALLNYVNGQLSHTPSQPAGFPDGLYDLGYNGAGNSNIAWASWQNGGLNRTIVNSWMHDGSASNISALGHRRWILHPSLKKTGFGAVSGTKGTYSAGYTADNWSAATSYTGVVWPAQNMPTQYFNHATEPFPWSVSVGSTLNAANIQVTLTRTSDGRVWQFSEASAAGDFYVNNSNYGQKGCIIFRPSGVGTYEHGDVYQVSITGTPAPISYNVNFFDLNSETEASVSLDQQVLNFKEGDAAKTLIAACTETGGVIDWASSDTAVATVSETGVVTPVGAGNATITATLQGTQKQASCKVTVSHVPGVTATCTTPQTCAECGATLATSSHQYEEEYTVDVAATCHTTGSKSKHCTRCDSKSEVMTIPTDRTKHTYVTTVVKPTENAGGYDKHTCSTCGHTYTDNTTAALGKPAVPVPAKGKKVTVGNLVYQVSISAKTGGEVQVLKAAQKTVTSITIPKTIKISGYSFKVTAIAKNAFKNHQKLKKVVIGGPVKEIGAKAFYNCKKLKSVQIKSSVLKSIGKNAFGKIHAKATIKVPASKLKAYKKLIKGIPKTVKIKK